MTSNEIRRFTRPAVTGLAIVAVLAGVVASPLALRWFGDLGGADWSRLSDIGQAYGAASALLSGLGFVMVAVTLAGQFRDARATRREGLRTFHHQLIQLAMDDSDLRACWGPSNFETWPAERRNMYVNLIISFWQMNYLAGVGSEQALRTNAARLFSAAPGREHWRRFGGTKIAHSADARERRFHAILDEEYRTAIRVPVQPGRMPAAPWDTGPDHHQRYTAPMDAAGLKKLCLALAGAREEFPFGEATSVFKVAGKMFALSQLGGAPLRISLKCDPELAVRLRLDHAAITAGYHLNKKHWNTVTIDGSLPARFVREMIEDSYDLVVAGLPRREQEKLNWIALARE